MGLDHNLDDTYNLDENKKRNIIIDNLNDPESIRNYFANMRKEIRAVYSKKDDLDKLSQIDEDLKTMLDTPQFNFMKESVTTLFNSLQSIHKLRNEYIFLFDIVFFNLEELALRILPHDRSSEPLTLPEMHSQALDKKVREVVTEYMSQNAQKECLSCNNMNRKDAKFCDNCGNEL